MSLINKIKFLSFMISTVAMVANTPAALAGNEGVSMYYGVGGSILKDEDSTFQVTEAASLIFGIEEDGWGLEATAFTSLDGVVEIPGFISDIRYSVDGSTVTLNYRTIEDVSGSYYKFKYGTMDLEYNFKGDVTGNLTTEGDIYGVAIGWRLTREERIELGLEVYDADELSDDLRMLTLNYLFGGSSYSGPVLSEKGDNPFYFGLSAGQLNADIPDVKDAAAYGVLVGFDFTPLGAKGFALELAHVTSDKLEDKDFPDTAWVEVSFTSLSAVYRMDLSNKMYVKFNAGYGMDVFEVVVSPLRETSSDTAIVYGAGIGYRLDSGSSIELNYTALDYTDSEIDITPNVISLSYIF